VLAHACLGNRRICESWHPSREVLTRCIQSGRRDHAFTSIRIEFRPMCINRELETASVQIRQSVNEIVEVNPGRQHALIETLISGRNAKKENFLPRDVNQLPKQFRKQLWQPWPAGKYETFCINSLSGDCVN